VPGQEAGWRTKAEAEVVEPDHVVGAHLEDAGDGPQVVLADGQHPAVEVLALDLDHPEVPLSISACGPGELLELGEVDGHLARLRPAMSEPLGKSGPSSVGQQLVDRHVVEAASRWRRGTEMARSPRS
jgi:hypothetical protein